MTTTPSTNDLTRQQLEELDALLQRMLTAPTVGDDRRPKPLPVDVTPPLPTGETVVESWRVDRPTPAPVKAPHVEVPEPVVMLSTAPAVEEPYLAPPVARIPANLLTNYAPVGDDTRVDPADVTEDDLPTLGGPRLPVVPMTPATPVSMPKAVTLPAGESLPQFGRVNLADLGQPSPPAELPPPPPPQPIARATPSAGESLPAHLWPLYAVNWVAEECLKVFGGESLTKPAAKWSMGVAGLLMLAGAAAWTAHGFGFVTLK